MLNRRNARKPSPIPPATTERIRERFRGDLRDLSEILELPPDELALRLSSGPR